MPTPTPTPTIRLGEIIKTLHGTTTIIPQYFQHQGKKSKLEETLEQLDRNFKIFMAVTDTISKNQKTSMRNLNA